MGPGEPPSESMPNVLVIGDSVSIGYVGGVANILNASGVAKVCVCACVCVCVRARARVCVCVCRNFLTLFYTYSTEQCSLSAVSA